MRAFEICRLNDLPVRGSRGFSVSTPGGAQDIFLVRQRGRVFGYRNSCPHTGGPLDWVPDQFLNLEENLIQCATHDALFRIEDGLCLKGPCAGQSLKALAVEVNGDRVSIIMDVSRCE